LEFCNDVGLYDVGFVGLMKVNEYAKNHFVDIDINELIDKTTQWGLYKIKETNCFDECKCANYLYLPKNFKEESVRVYARQVMDLECTSDLLVFDGEKIKTHF